MKKMLFAGMGAYIITIALTTRLHAQQSGDAPAFNYHAPVNKQLIATNSHKSFLENFHLAEINLKAVRHFTRSFDEDEHVQWYQTYNGVVAYFTVKGIKTRAAYDKKGNWLYIIRTYSESDLPVDIRDQVKYMFNDFTITQVNEITNSCQLIYEVQIEDKTSLKTVTVCDGNIQVGEEFVKQ